MIQIQHLLLFNMAEWSKFDLSVNSNTTPVIVQQWSLPVLPICGDLFKYNTCYSSTIFSQMINCRKFIQIQHLLLFIATTGHRDAGNSIIQIQHLLLFNEPMPLYLHNLYAFKYNTCYCSTEPIPVSGSFCPHSNTTLVNVQRPDKTISWPPAVIQIQHLLMFNCNAYFAGRGYVRIQTQHLLMFNGILIDRCAVSKLIQIQHLLMFNDF